MGRGMISGHYLCELWGFLETEGDIVEKSRYEV